MFGFIDTGRKWINKSAKYLMGGLFMSAPILTGSVAFAENKEVEDTAALWNQGAMTIWAMVESGDLYRQVINMPVSDAQFKRFKNAAKGVAFFGSASALQYLLLALNITKPDETNLGIAMALNELLFASSVYFGRQCKNIIAANRQSNNSQSNSNQSLALRIPDCRADLFKTLVILSVLPIMVGSTLFKEDHGRVVPLNTLLIAGFAYLGTCHLQGITLDTIDKSLKPRRMSEIWEKIALAVHAGATVGYAIDQLVKSGKISPKEQIALATLGEALIVHAKNREINIQTYHKSIISANQLPDNDGIDIQSSNNPYQSTQLQPTKVIINTDQLNENDNTDRTQNVTTISLSTNKNITMSKPFNVTDDEHIEDDAEQSHSNSMK